MSVVESSNIDIELVFYCILFTLQSLIRLENIIYIYPAVGQGPGRSQD